MTALLTQNPTAFRLVLHLGTHSINICYKNGGQGMNGRCDIALYSLADAFYFSSFHSFFLSSIFLSRIFFSTLPHHIHSPCLINSNSSLNHFLRDFSDLLIRSNYLASITGIHNQSNSLQFSNLQNNQLETVHI